MALVVATLYNALSDFADRRDPEYQAPMTEDEARTAWAKAFATYIKPIAPSNLPAVPADTSHVEGAFHDALRLLRGFGVPNPATDLAKAWRTSVVTIPVVTSWNVGVLDLREIGLRTRLDQLFAAPSLDAPDQLAKIAAAFHTATLAMPTVPPPTVPITYQ